MNIDPDLVPAFCIIAVGAIVMTCRNLGPSLGRNPILGRMSSTTSRWIGSALLATAIVVFFATNKIVDVPFPDEFDLELSPSFLLVSAALAVAGTLSLASSFRTKA
jgi:hypothetical protein